METHNCFNLINNDNYFKGVGSFIKLNLTSIKVYCEGNFLFKIGLSDHHHIIYSIIKSTFEKKEPKHSIYRNYNQFYCEHFENEKSSSLVENGNNFNAYEKPLNNAINLNASKEVKVFRGYHELHCKKNFQKAVTTK